MQTMVNYIKGLLTYLRSYVYWCKSYRVDHEKNLEDCYYQQV